MRATTTHPLGFVKGVLIFFHFVMGQMPASVSRLFSLAITSWISSPEIKCMDAHTKATHRC
eukprot:1483010-Amphidinium_carterae.1